MSSAVSPLPPPTFTPVGHGRLALILQEALTAVVRLRAGRQPLTDAAGFRAQMTQLLVRADAEARAAGYEPEDVRLALFAVVALIDESVLNAAGAPGAATPQAAAAEWARRPLQEELFGQHMAGEWFFQHVEQLLARLDSATLADLLEVHELCLLLGFRGRYGAGDPAALHTVASRVGERVARMRGTAGLAGVPAGDLVLGWQPPNDAVVGRDPWLRRLAIALAASVVLAVALWGAASVSLRGASAAVAAHTPADASASTPSR
jgi:type VI secretion system protein ImpK